jgi:hypothetical protein
MGNRLAVRVSCDYTPIFFVSASLLGEDGQSGSNPRAFRIGSEKHPWDMPTSQSNSVLESWIHADLSLRNRSHRNRFRISLPGIKPPMQVRT